jgi:DNA-binding MarR family transcriptional regulator
MGLSKVYSEMNNFLVRVFNGVLRTEEASLRTKEFKNLSIREMHIIEAVCEGNEYGKNTASEIALSQKITAGTLTATISNLEKKGYVIRQRDERDKRMVRIFPTDRGKTANELHQTFHHEMVSKIISVLSGEEQSVFVKGLAAVQRFLEESKNL